MFDYTFSVQGGIYSLDHYKSHYPQYMRFMRNSYSNIYCLDSAIMRAEVFGSEITSQISIHNYTDETLFQVQNGAFSYYGKNNELLTYFYGLDVKDSYGVTLDSQYYTGSTNTLF